FGDHALRQVVETLEALPAGDRELTGGEEVLERALLRLPPPHRPAPPLERAHGQRTLLADARQHALLDLPPFHGSLAPPPVVVAEREHPPLEEPVVVDRQQARLVRPVFEDAAVAEERRDVGLVVGTEPGREREPVGAIDGRDRVELHGLQPRDLGRDVRCARAPEAAGVALVRDDVAAERRQADCHLLWARYPSRSERVTTPTGFPSRATST